MTEYERVREEIAKILCLADGLDWEALPQRGYPSKKDREYYFNCAYAILSLNGIEIKSDDQSYPEIPRKDIVHIIMERDTMLREAGFIKVIPKEEYGS